MDAVCRACAERERVIAILVDRLGGDVLITERERQEAPIELFMSQEPSSFAHRLRARRAPQPGDDDVIDAEVVEDAPLAIEAR